MISIVIPFHDKHAYLDDTLASIARQNLAPEVVIVDDGSRAPVDPITDRWRDRLAIRIVRQPRRGASAARNRGLAASRGDQILCLDADDLLAPGCLAELAGALGDADAAIGSLVEAWPHRRGFAITRCVPAAIPAFPEDWLADRHVFGQTVLFRRSTIAAIGPWDEALPRWQDTNYVLRLLMRRSRLALAPAAVTIWRRGDPDAITADPDTLASAFVNVVLVIDHLARTGELEQHRDAIAGYYRILAGYGIEQRDFEFAIDCIRRMRAIDPRSELPTNDWRERARVVRELLRASAALARDRVRAMRPLEIAGDRDALLVSASGIARRWSATAPRTRPAPSRSASTT